MNNFFRGLILVLVLFFAFDNSFSDVEKNPEGEKTSLYVKVKQYLKSNKVSSVIIGLLSVYILSHTKHIPYKSKESLLETLCMIQPAEKFLPSEYFKNNNVDMGKCPDAFKDYYKVFLRDFHSQVSQPNYRTTFNSLLVYENGDYIVEEILYTDEYNNPIHTFRFFHKDFLAQEIKKFKIM